MTQIYFQKLQKCSFIDVIAICQYNNGIAGIGSL